MEVDILPSNVYLVDTDGKRWETLIENGAVTIPPEPENAILGDINHDGVVNIQDLIIVNVRFGQTGENSADINGDRIVNIVDLVDEKVASGLYFYTLKAGDFSATRKMLIRK